MTEWNLNNPYDLGIWDELGESSPASETEDLLPLKRTKTARKPIANKKSKQEARPPKSGKGKERRFENPQKSVQSYQEPFCPENTKILPK